ncbi:MFS transporter permease [Microbacterium sp.]|uniref:MFS transporter permease n=1 Tax=Microbacterium sp. TaxID=51671 RepID=UPI0039E53E4E
MWVRRAFFRWLIPAAVVLPLWLVVGWIVFGANPWALLWVLVSAPIVFIGQIVLTLLVRARGTVRTDRAVSWTDVGVIGAWHVFIVALGVFDGRWWWPTLAVTIAVGVAAFCTSLSQLWREARPSTFLLRTSDGVGYIPPTAEPASERVDPDVLIVRENRPPTS